jgi:hypothetical protein
VEVREVHGEIDSTAAERYDFSALADVLEVMPTGPRPSRLALLCRDDQAAAGFTRAVDKYSGTRSAKRRIRCANLTAWAVGLSRQRRTTL